MNAFCCFFRNNNNNNIDNSSSSSNGPMDVVGRYLNCHRRSGCVLSKRFVDSVLARNDFDALKQTLVALQSNQGDASNSGKQSSRLSHKLNRLYGDETLVQLAVKFQRVDVVELLLALGASPDAMLKSSLSALTRAVIVNNEELFEALLAAGADPNLASDDDRATPLHFAVIVNRPFAVAALLAHPRTDIDRPDAAGMTPLHHAAKSRNRTSLALLRSLVQAGAALDAVDTRHATTPLHYAVRNPQKVAELCELIEPGSALLAARDGLGLNAVQRALMKDESESAELLLRHGASLNVVPPVFVERVLTAVIAGSSPLVVRHLLLSLADATCSYFSASVSPPAGLFDMAFTMRRLDVAVRLSWAGCLPRSRRPRSHQISTLIAQRFNTPPSLQCIARVAIRRALRTSDAKRYESLVASLDLPLMLRDYLLFSDIECRSTAAASALIAAVAVPDIAGLRQSALVNED